MQFSKAEIEVLCMCAWCKDLPVNRCRNIPAEILDSLRHYRLIRLSRNKLGYRCTPEGIALLQGAEMNYEIDKSYRTNADTLLRRFQVAEIMTFFWRCGADVFAEAPPAERNRTTFLPAFALRRSKNANFFGNAKLTGFYYTQDYVFIPYFITKENCGVYPELEQRDFRAEMLLQGRKPHILYTGEGDLEKIIETVSYKKEHSKKLTSAYYKDAIGMFNCPVAIMPMNAEGMRQLRILSVPNYRQRLMKNLLGENYLPPTSTMFDGRTKSENCIIGFDCNILRFENAVRSEKPTSIFVLPFQSDFVKDLVEGSNATSYVIDFDLIEDYFGLPHALPTIDRTPFRTVKGGYVDVPFLGKTKKTGG